MVQRPPDPRGFGTAALWDGLAPSEVLPRRPFAMRPKLRFAGQTAPLRIRGSPPPPFPYPPHRSSSDPSPPADTTAGVSGASEHCITAYPGDMAVLAADTPDVENEMKPGEIITAVALPAASADKRFASARRESLWAALRQSHGELGRPKRRCAIDRRRSIPSVMPQLAVRDARPYRDNAFKIKLAHRCGASSNDRTRR